MADKELSKKAYDILLNRIITNEYPSGFMLNELGLQAELNISRTPIHTAMVMLQRDNLVEILPKRGIVVSHITAETIRDIYDVRELIELYALRNFGHIFPKDKLLEYLKVFSIGYETDIYDRVFGEDVQFHMDIVGLTNNKVIISYYSSLKNQFIRLSNLSGRNNERRVSLSNVEHGAIIKAMLQDDIDSAVEAMKEHLKKARETAYKVIILHDNTPNF